MTIFRPTEICGAARSRRNLLSMWPPGGGVQAIAAVAAILFATAAFPALKASDLTEPTTDLLTKLPAHLKSKLDLAQAYIQQVRALVSAT